MISVNGFYSAPADVSGACLKLRSEGFQEREIAVLRHAPDSGDPWDRLLCRCTGLYGQTSVLDAVVWLAASLHPGARPQQMPHRYASRLIAGDTLITVFCDPAERAIRAGEILRDTGAKDIDPPPPARPTAAAPGIAVPSPTHGAKVAGPDWVKQRKSVPVTSFSAAEIEPVILHLIAEARQTLEAIAAETGTRTFENTLLALDQLTEPLDHAMGLVRHLESVATTPELRAACNAVQPEASAFYEEIPFHGGLWRAIRAYSATPEARALTGVRRRYLEKTLADFRRHGADLDAAGKKRLSEIDAELVQATTRFSGNVLDSTNAFELAVTEESRLAGLPASAVDAAHQCAARRGMPGWCFTLQAPDYFAIQTYLDDASLRRQVYEAFGSRATSGAWDNRPVVRRILELRHAKARLLGYTDFAAWILETRMARTGDRALAYLEQLRAGTEPRFREENRSLLEFRRSMEGPRAPELQPWDMAYYAEKERSATIDWTDEEARPYFALENVVQGVFDLLERLYGIHIVERTGVQAWDPEVRYYEAHEEDGRLLGGFFTDWLPRENKRGGAWMDTLIAAGPPATSVAPVGVVCANLTPPCAGEPSLLTMREVETVFHLTGYLVHLLFSRLEIRALSGTNVAWDFVALPSQIMENWCYEREMLDLFARHYQTGALIPDHLFQRMQRARTFRAANAQMRQLGFGTLDLMLHARYSPERDGDPAEYSRRILQEFYPAPLPPSHTTIAAFTHLFASPVAYAAGYYSYKWAEMLDADAFSRFREGGIFNRTIGRQFRDCILSQGDAVDPAELFFRFMGRAPDVKPMLRRANLV